MIIQQTAKWWVAGRDTAEGVDLRCQLLTVLFS
jgi:hypothetical protein